MSLVWTLIATFLYAEIAVVLLLVLPIASPQRWQRFFRSRFLALLTGQAQTYFYLLLGVLVLFVLEAIREMRKYSHTDESAAGASMNHEMQQSMRLFRAQRNFYIAGFAIFLVLVVRRLITLISGQATLLAQAEASMRQAQSASDAARSLMKSDTKPTGAKPSAPAEEDVTSSSAAAAEQSAELKQKVATLQADLVRERKDKEALKSQSESLAREYDRLTEEYSKLQRHVTVSSPSAKDETETSMPP